MTLGRCVVRFSEKEMRALDDLRGTKGIPRVGVGQYRAWARAPVSVQVAAVAAE
jgi:hypothetical protein